MSKIMDEDICLYLRVEIGRDRSDGRQFRFSAVEETVYDNQAQEV